MDWVVVSEVFFSKRFRKKLVWTIWFYFPTHCAAFLQDLTFHSHLLYTFPSFIEQPATSQLPSTHCSLHCNIPQKKWFKQNGVVENVVCVKWIVDIQRQTDQALGKSVRYDQGIFYLFVGFNWNAWSWNSTKWFWNNTDKFIKHVHRIKKRSPHIFLDPSYWNPNIYKKMKGVASWDSDLFPMCGLPPVHCGFPSGLTGAR